MSKDFLSAVADRRTFYHISKEVEGKDNRIKEIIDHAVKYTPSAFNSQSARVVLLLGKHHEQLWDMVINALRKLVPADQFGSTEDKINSFKNGYGTILFYEDINIIEGLQKQFPLYGNNFPIWSQQASGMHQFVIWTALEEEGLGVSLQHYNEVIEADVKKEWNIPDNWKLIAQMPFGKPTKAPDEKEFLPIDSRVMVFK